MFRRTTFTTITPLPASMSRDAVISFLQDHLEMIDLNPLVKERHPISPPPHAEPEEHTCVWYSLTDKISYLPGDLYTGDVTYTCAFRDVPDGLQTHCYAPAGLHIREKWTVQGSQPAVIQAAGPEPGAPEAAGLYIREEVDMRCNILLTAFVKRTLKKSHAALVERLKVRAQAGSSSTPGTTTTGMEGGGVSGAGGLLTSSPSSGETGTGSTTTSNGPGATRLITAAGAGAPGQARTPSPNPGAVSAEAMQYYRHWESPSSPPPLPRKDSPPPPKDGQVSDSQRRAAPRQASPDSTLQMPPPPPPKDQHVSDPPNPTPPSLPAKSHQYLDTPQHQDADQQPPSGPGRSPSTVGLVPAPLRIRSRSPPLQRLENPPMGSRPSTAEIAATAPENAGEQAIPEVKVLEDSPIGARLKGPFVAQLP